MRKQRSIVKKWISAALCAALVLSSAACAQQDGKENGAAAVSEKESGGTGQTEAAAFSPPADTQGVIPDRKEESVYVKADAYGAPKETTVEVTLKGIDEGGSKPVEDRSNLREIKNTEGDEEFSGMGEGRYLWENHGEDIHYKGKSDADLPVDVHVTYYLEGQEVTADEIAGKTGAVRMRFDYDNHTDVPFMVLTSVLFSADVFEDVDVTNGKVMDLGDRKVVIGYAFPGLMDSLKLADYEPTEEIDLPQYVEIEARAEDFDLDFTATVVSTGLFDEVEDKDLDDLEEMSDDMEELTDASSELTDAAFELSEAGSEFGGYLSQYFEGVSKIGEGADALDKGLGEISGNISKITEGSSEVDKGLAGIGKALSEVNTSLLSSADGGEEGKKVKEALTGLGTGSASLKEKMTELGTGLEALGTFEEDIAEYCGKVEALRAAIDENPAPALKDRAQEMAGKLNAAASEQADAAVREKAESAAKGAAEEAAQTAAHETAESARNTVESAVNESGALDGLGLTEEQIEEVKNSLISEIQSGIEENSGDTPEITVDPESVDIDLGDTLDGILGEVQEDLDTGYGAICKAAEGLTPPKVPDLSAMDDSSMEEIRGILESMGTSLGVISEYAKGMGETAESVYALSSALNQLQAGAAQVQDGSASLTGTLGMFEEALEKTAEGSKALSSALGQVSEAGSQLKSASGMLVEGMEEFADGVSEFDKEGIRSLAELAGPEFLDVVRGIRAARDAEHDYTNFSGLCDGQKGSVRFVIETEEISGGD